MRNTNRSHDAALWFRGRARKNAPLLLPCMDPYAAGVGLSTVLCLGKAAMSGKLDLRGSRHEEATGGSRSNRRHPRSHASPAAGVSFGLSLQQIIHLL